MPNQKMLPNHTLITVELMEKILVGPKYMKKVKIKGKEHFLKTNLKRHYMHHIGHDTTLSTDLVTNLKPT